MVLTLRTGEDYTPAVETLRQAFIHNRSLRPRTMSDRWDASPRSKLLNVHARSGKLVATARITRGAATKRIQNAGVLEDWTKGRCAVYLPHGPNVMAITRASTGTVQNRGIYGALIVAAMAHAAKCKGVTTVCALVKSDLDIAQWVLCKRLHFVEVQTSDPLISFDVPGQPVEVRPVYYDLAAGLERQWDYVRRKLDENDVHIRGLEELAGGALCTA